MMRNSMCIDTVSPKQERLLKYKRLAMAFSYPDDNFFAFFPRFLSEKEKLVLEHDRLFRSQEIWLYCSEYGAENEFQRAKNLADINGFYRAFGLQTSFDRPDALSSELEFMYYLIFKQLYACKINRTSESEEKKSICFDAQKKFFNEHIYPAAKQIAENIITQTENDFYREVARELIEFLKIEKIFLDKDK